MSKKKDELNKRDTIDNTKKAPLTTNQGLPVSEDEFSLKAGERGPTLMEDFHLREKITHFDHERIPERTSMPEVSVSMVNLKFMNHWKNIQRQNF